MRSLELNRSFLLYTRMNFEIAIIGGGLAGLTAALHSVQLGHSVILFEKKDYPQQKVCGEYLSNEVLPYWQSLGIDLSTLSVNKVTQFSVYPPSGKAIHSLLPLGGFGVTRYRLEAELAKLAVAKGVILKTNTTIQTVQPSPDGYQLTDKKGHQIECRLVLGAYGKKSNLDRLLERQHRDAPAPYLSVKHYLDADFPKGQVCLWNFPGGYCGGTLVEDGSLNLSYLIKESTLKKYGSIAAMEVATLHQNEHLRAILINSTPRLSKPLTISNITFAEKQLVEHGVIHLGDAAGMIFPLCGNGMAMAIHAAKIAVELSHQFLLDNINRTKLESAYTQQWNRHFRQRLAWGRRLQPFMEKTTWADTGAVFLRTFPALLPLIIKRTHGTALPALTPLTAAESSL